MVSSRAMKETSELRRSNLNAYFVRRGLVSTKNPDQGSPAELVKLLGRTSSFWSNRLTGIKTIGEEVAREVEEKLGLPKYALDGDEENSDFVSVSHISVEVSAGPGRMSHVIEEVGSLQFRRDFLRSVGVSPSNAAVVSVVGMSMEPTIKDGAVLLLNKADHEPRSGNIYAFSWGEDMLVKRFVSKDGAWLAVSDNPDKEEFPDIVIDGSAASVIQGRAIWMGARL